MGRKGVAGRVGCGEKPGAGTFIASPEGKSSSAQQTVVVTAGASTAEVKSAEACTAEVKSAGACTAGVNSTGACTAEVKSAGECTPQVKSTGACTAEVKSTQAPKAAARSAEACAAAIAALRKLRRALRAEGWRVWSMFSGPLGYDQQVVSRKSHPRYFEAYIDWQPCAFYKPFGQHFPLNSSRKNGVCTEPSININVYTKSRKQNRVYTEIEYSVY